MNLKDLAAELKDYEGVRRKAGIGSVVEALGLGKKRGRDTFFFDDAAVVELGGMTILFACDSITEGLVNLDPYFAGYSAVLVNLNDIAAMGGKAIAVVDVLSAKDLSTARKIARGVGDASLKFGVPVVGGHFNPNSTYNGIEVSIIGKAEGSRLIKGTGARPGEGIIAAVDLDGRFHPGYPFAWDCTTKKTPAQVRGNLQLLIKLAELGAVRSGRDISNPGLIGTIGMLLEGSGAGGRVELEKIPLPVGVEISTWLKAYPGFGFVFTAERSKIDGIERLFRRRGIAAASIGKVINSRKLLISWRGREEEVFDFEKEGITRV